MTRTPIDTSCCPYTCSACNIQCIWYVYYHAMWHYIQVYSIEWKVYKLVCLVLVEDRHHHCPTQKKDQVSKSAYTSDHFVFSAFVAAASVCVASHLSLFSFPLFHLYLLWDSKCLKPFHGEPNIFLFLTPSSPWSLLQGTFIHIMLPKVPTTMLLPSSREPMRTTKRRCHCWILLLLLPCRMPRTRRCKLNMKLSLSLPLLLYTMVLNGHLTMVRPCAW